MVALVVNGISNFFLTALFWGITIYFFIPSLWAGNNPAQSGFRITDSEFSF